MGCLLIYVFVSKSEISSAGDKEDLEELKNQKIKRSTKKETQKVLPKLMFFNPPCRGVPKTCIGGGVPGGLVINYLLLLSQHQRKLG